MSTVFLPEQYIKPYLSSDEYIVQTGLTGTKKEQSQGFLDSLLPPFAYYYVLTNLRFFVLKKRSDAVFLTSSHLNQMEFIYSQTYDVSYWRMLFRPYANLWSIIRGTVISALLGNLSFIGLFKLISSFYAFIILVFIFPAFAIAFIFPKKRFSFINLYLNPGIKSNDFDLFVEVSCWEQIPDIIRAINQSRAEVWKHINHNKQAS